MKIVFLVSRFPFPLEKGDKLRAYQHIRNLYDAGHEVHLIALSDLEPAQDSISKVNIYCKSIIIFRLHLMDILKNLLFSFRRKLPLQVAYFYSPSLQHKIEKHIIQTKPDLIYCQLIRTASYVKNIKNIPLLIDYQDAFSKGTFQRMQKSPWIYRSLFKRELKLVNDFEKISYDWFTGHIIISEQDRMALNVNPEKDIVIIPNGIDTSFFKPVHGEVKFDITFVGNMNYPPNVDGAYFLIREIMPIVWKKIPGARVQIGGANPNARVKNLASELVTVTGWMDDIRDCYKNTKIFIAPMRIGTGLQNKLLEAMAMQIACITTPLSFEPLKAKKDTDILVGSSAEELADLVIKLLHDNDLRSDVALKGFNFVLENYSMKHSLVQLDDTIKSTIKQFRNGIGNIEMKDGSIK